MSLLPGAVVTSSSPSPYVGLRAFLFADRERFYGRREESDEISVVWRGRRFTILYGASGVGKTSVLNAGVIPRFDAAHVDVLPVGRISPRSLVPADVVGYNPYTLALLSSWERDRPVRELLGLGLRDYFAQRERRVDPYGDPVPVLIAIDQAEELFSDLPHRQGYVEPFLAELADLLDENAGIRLLLSMREDYLASVLPYELMLGGGARARIRLLPLRPDQALQAVEDPLRGLARSFAPGAAETLVNDLRMVRLTNGGGEGRTLFLDAVEPAQLQVVCSALWESLPPELTEITSVHVRRYADVDRFLADFCSRVIAQTAHEQGVPAVRLRLWMQRTFITDLGTRGTAYEGLSRTAGMPNKVVHALEDMHLLRAERRAGTRWYELQHDRLIGPLRQAEPSEQLQAAQQEFEEGELDHAEAHAEQAVSGAQVSGDLRTQAGGAELLAEIARLSGRPELAEKYYREAVVLLEVLQDQPRVGALLSRLGTLMLDQGRPRAAVADLESAVGRVPNDPDVQAAFGWALWHCGHLPTALTVLDGCLALRGDHVPALRARGEALLDSGDPAAALADLDRVRKGQPPETQAARALALARLGRGDAAMEELADALANSTEDPRVLVRAAAVSLAFDDPPNAVAFATRALSGGALPDHLRAWVTKAVLNEA